MPLNLYMIGVVTKDMPKALEFYRRLGLAVPDGVEGKTHVQIKMEGGLTFFLDSNPSRFDPRFPADPNTHPRQVSDRYPFLLEFYLKERAAVDAKHKELTDLGYEDRGAPYVTPYGMYFAWVSDPDGNAILLSAD
jgi:catechol 2,3-dioxygenase-like lactoylglutathione lyase family enzyme